MSQDCADAARLVGLPHGQPSAVETGQPNAGEIERSTRRLSRRSLLHLGAAATAGTLVGIRPWATASAAAAAAAGPAFYLRRSSYTGLTGQSFGLASGTLRLLSVSDVAGAAVDKSLAGAEAAFVLAFARPLDAVLESGTHVLSHTELGAFELFVSPVGRPQRDLRYEAVVDRSTAARRPPRRRRLRRRAKGQSARAR